MLGVGQGDNVNLFSSSWDCFLTIAPLINLNRLLAHPHCLGLVNGGGVLLHRLVVCIWGFILVGCEERSELKS